MNSHLLSREIKNNSWVEIKLINKLIGSALSVMKLKNNATE
jgi:hypothetical protein